MITVALTNASTAVSDAAVQALLPALQTQVTRDLAPAWPGSEASLVYVPATLKPDPSYYPVVVLDDTDQADALGYHDTNSAGIPVGKVFAKSDIEAGENWTVTTSHELLEMLCDPQIDATLPATYNGKRVITIREVCDPVEDCDYEIDGQRVSNFVLPAYYGDGDKFDFLGRLTGPMTLAPGGYISFCGPDGSWSQTFGERVTTWKEIPPHGSRRERLRIGPRRWQRSTAL
jgi:hypothetical protein